MEIIKEGNKNRERFFHCNECGCKWIATKSECKKTGKLMKILTFGVDCYMDCPTCSEETYPCN